DVPHAAVAPSERDVAAPSLQLEGDAHDGALRHALEHRRAERREAPSPQRAAAAGEVGLDVAEGDARLEHALEEPVEALPLVELAAELRDQHRAGALPRVDHEVIGAVGDARLGLRARVDEAALAGDRVGRGLGAFAVVEHEGELADRAAAEGEEGRAAADLEVERHDHAAIFEDELARQPELFAVAARPHPLAKASMPAVERVEGAGFGSQPAAVE